MTQREYNRLKIRERAEAADQMRHERAIRMFSRAMGLGERCSSPGTVIHNAANDCETRIGWMHGKSREVCRIVKRAAYMLNQWPASRLADAIYDRCERV